MEWRLPVAGAAEYTHRAVLALARTSESEAPGACRRRLMWRAAQFMRASGLYQNNFGGYSWSADFVNADIEVATDPGASELLQLCNAVEAAHHRERLVRWGPRNPGY